MNAWFEVHQVAEGALVFQLHRACGEVLLSSIVFHSHGELLAGIEALRRQATAASAILRCTGEGPTHLFLVHDAAGQLLAKSELHARAWAMEWALSEVQQVAATAEVRDAPVDAAEPLRPAATPSLPPR